MEGVIHIFCCSLLYTTSAAREGWSILMMPLFMASLIKIVLFMLGPGRVRILNRWDLKAASQASKLKFRLLNIAWLDLRQAMECSITQTHRQSPCVHWMLSTCARMTFNQLQRLASSANVHKNTVLFCRFIFLVMFAFFKGCFVLVKMLTLFG